MNTQEYQQNTVPNPAAPAGPTATSGFHPLQVIMQRRWQLLACMLLVSSVALAVMLLRTPHYEAIARVEVIEEQAQAGGLNALLGQGGNKNFAGQCELLYSRAVLGRAAEKLNLSSNQWPYSDQTIDLLRDSIKAKPVSGSQLIDIVAQADTPEPAAAMANQVAVAFLETCAEQRHQKTQRLLKQLQQRIEEFSQQALGQETALQEFRQENLITAIDSSLAAVEQRIRALETRLSESQMLQLQLQTKQTRLKNLLTGDPAFDEKSLPQEIVEHGSLRSLRTTLEGLSQEEAQLAKTYLPGHQKLRTIRLRIADLQGRLIEQKQDLLQTLYRETIEKYEDQLKQDKDIQALLEEQRQGGVELTNRHNQHTEMMAQLQLTRQFQMESVKQLEQLRLQQKLQEAPVRIVDSAQIPEKPAGLTRTHQAASVLLLGLLFSFVFIFALDHFDTAPNSVAPPSPSMYYPPGYIPVMASGANWPNGPWTSPGSAYPSAVEVFDPTTAGPGNPWPPSPQEAPRAEPQVVAQGDMILGTITPIDLAAGHYTDMAFAARCRLVHNDPACEQSAALRTISTKLLARFGQSKQSVVVTSSQRYSGKTMCACNLALLLAQTGRNVLLVDSNNDAAALHRVFPDNGDQPSLNDVFEDFSVLNEALQDTAVAHLSILHHTGEAGDSGQENLEAVVRLNSELRRRFDWVIYDTGRLELPLSKNLLQAVGKTLLLAPHAAPDELAAATRQIELCGAVNIGCIENTHVCAAEMHQAPAPRAKTT